MTKVYLYEYGSNKFLRSFKTSTNVGYAVGDFYILDTEIKDNFRENMYLVKAVSHFLPAFVTEEPQVALHLEKYDPDAVSAFFDEFKKKLKERLDEKEQQEKEQGT